MIIHQSIQEIQDILTCSQHSSEISTVTWSSLHRGWSPLDLHSHLAVALQGEAVDLQLPAVVNRSPGYLKSTNHYRSDNDHLVEWQPLLTTLHLHHWGQHRPSRPLLREDWLHRKSIYLAGQRQDDSLYFMVIFSSWRLLNAKSPMGTTNLKPRTYFQESEKKCSFLGRLNICRPRIDVGFLKSKYKSGNEDREAWCATVAGDPRAAQKVLHQSNSNSMVGKMFLITRSKKNWRGYGNEQQQPSVALRTWLWHRLKMGLKHRHAIFETFWLHQFWNIRNNRLNRQMKVHHPCDQNSWYQTVPRRKTLQRCTKHSLGSHVYVPWLFTSHFRKFV